jgi:2-oxoglutarate dehydrogenase E2 component (dihydrolipoamide succinyltransferase)
MPQLGETVADGTVTKWFKQVGDNVVKGEALFEVSTDKVDTEIPAPVTGVLTAILVDEGVTVDVGTTLATIEASGATPSGVSDIRTDSVSSAPGAIVDALTSTSRVLRDSSSGVNKLSPAVRRLLDEHKLAPENVPATGPGGRLTRDDVLAFVASSTQVAAATSLSPVLRRLLDENHLDADSIRGTGTEGRLTRHDVETAIAGAATASNDVDDEVIPFTKARRLTAEHMIRSKATSAHTLMVKEVDFERVEMQRRRYGATFSEREGFTLTYLPFIAVAVLAALRAFPRINASVGDDELIVHRHLNLGIAVDLDGDGLVVPVIRDADQYDVFSIARRIRELAHGARTKKLTIDDMSGGTFTITNPGPFGTLLTGAVINQPQIAILATDGISRKPVVVTSATGEESIAIHSVGLLALTFDHRAIDGATAARFLAHVAATLNDSDLIAAP